MGFILVAFTALIASLLQAPAATASAQRTITWEPCPEDATVDCGKLTLPIDWSNPQGPTFEFAVARRKATNPAARIGSLVYQPGGPGGSGVQDVLANYLPFTPELASRFDIVGIDPRGVGRSQPVLCSMDLLLQAPQTVLKNQADFDAVVAFNTKRREDCRTRTGPMFDHVDTLNVAHDLEALREALGDDKLTYYGISYGTLIGQIYAERYPGRVRALGLDANMDHSIGTRAFLDQESWALEDSFTEFVAWCGRTPSCALHGRDVKAVWADLYGRAERGELHAPGDPTLPITPLVLSYEVMIAGYVPSWAQLASVLAMLADGTGNAPMKAKPFTTTSEAVPYPLEIFCQDWQLPIRNYREYARHVKRSKAIAPNTRFSPLAFETVTSCLGHPSPIDNPQRRLRVDGTPTLLLGSSLHDPATPYPWSVSTARQIGREARLLTYEGWGHGAYPRSACAAEVFDRYLTDLVVPPRGSRCPAVPPAEVSTRSAVPAPLNGPLPGLPGWTLGS
ncbi:alpha/beta hydrolase [Sinosporangium album]|nr:alpha/beta hydrolase [Sinosporangium album]